MLLLPVFCWAQFSDDFSDGNFSSDPAWYGDTDKFIVEDGVLRLNDVAAGHAYLATSSRLVHNTQWEFWVRLAFTPSNNNHPRIYLVSDSHNLHGELNGYYIRIGKDGGDNKRMYFYRQDGTTSTEIMAGSMNIASGTNNRIRFKVTRDDHGNWEFFADQTGGNLFVPQGSVNDSNHTTSEWFGLRCQYTISNSNRFYFDDFFVGEILPDTVPPVVDFVQVTSSNTLKIYFNKVVEPVTAETVTNYVADNGVGYPVIANLDPFTPNTVNLIFAEQFIPNMVYGIHIANVRDHSGNMMVAYSGEFAYYQPRVFDVVFNELMINPTPSVNLPPYEYIELYNTTELPIDIEGWVLQHGSTRRTIPFAPIPAKGVLLLVTESAYPHLEKYGNVVAVPGLSGTALTNSGADLLLFDGQDNLISFVSYTDEWYQDPAKSNGGWSLEKVDPYNFCQGNDNWLASADPSGGTPGSENSVLADNPDVTPPSLVRAGYVDSNTIVLFFSESMDMSSLEESENYTADQGLGKPVSATALLPDFRRVSLTFKESLLPGTIYNISLSQNITDCAGNQADNRNARVAVPAAADSLDVVINEVLFNPPDRGARYIELYNRSEKVIDLKDYLITSKDTIDQFLTNIQEIADQSFLFFPGDYVVLTNNPSNVKNTFMVLNPAGFIRISAMPRMTNANGILVFASKGLQVIDMFAYEEDMHFRLLTSYKGVALERLNPDWPTQSRSNWHSAAQHVGFGTPGYKNSQYTAYLKTEAGKVEVYPEVFSPDGDGNEDVLTISYAFDVPGYVANIRIFDARGRQIKYLVRGELLSVEGVLTWDGTTDDNLKAPIGIYVIHMEVFDLQGSVKNYRNTAVLGGRL